MPSSNSGHLHVSRFPPIQCFPFPFLWWCFHRPPPKRTINTWIYPSSASEESMLELDLHHGEGYHSLTIPSGKVFWVTDLPSCWPLCDHLFAQPSIFLPFYNTSLQFFREVLDDWRDLKATGVWSSLIWHFLAVGKLVLSWQGNRGRTMSRPHLRRPMHLLVQCIHLYLLCCDF